MSRLIFVVAALGLVSACALAQPRLVTRPLDVPDAPAVAFAKALQATKAVHGAIERQEPTLGLIDARINQKVTLHIAIQPRGAGSAIAVAQKIAPDFVTPVPVTVADEWVRAYQTPR